MSVFANYEFVNWDCIKIIFGGLIAQTIVIYFVWTKKNWKKNPHIDLHVPFVFSFLFFFFFVVFFFLSLFFRFIAHIQS